MNNSGVLKFQDVVGHFEVLDDLVFLPQIETLTNLKGLKEAKRRLSIISGIILNNKSVLTTGSVQDRSYLFFYSDNHIFDSKRILKSKISEISLFEYLGVNIVVFFEHELKYLEEGYEALQNIDTEFEMFPKISVVFNMKDEKAINRNYSLLNKIFPTTEIFIFIGKDFKHIEQKKGTMLLC